VHLSETGALPNPVVVKRGPLDDMRPQPFQNGEWLSLREVFVFSKSGMKSGRDSVFVSAVQTRLRNQVMPRLAGRADPTYDASLERFYCYRPLDRRWFFNDLKLLNRPGPEMQRVWGDENIGIYAMPFGTGAGPAVWCHGLLPDYHAFSERGGYAFPLFDRRSTVKAPNLSAILLESLGAAYGEPVAAEDVFDGILSILSAPSYARRFSEDLEDVFPHIPFPAHLSVFTDAVRIGREIRLVETFARDPGEAYRPHGFANVETQPTGVTGSANYADGALILCADGSGRITGIPQQVWDFSVSRYPVLQRWIEGRKGLLPEFALVRELRDICGRIAELIDLFGQADIVLEATLSDTLTREALGFAAGEPNEDDGSS
jgi:predicted helicase